MEQCTCPKGPKACSWCVDEAHKFGLDVSLVSCPSCPLHGDWEAEPCGIVALMRGSE